VADCGQGEITQLLARWKQGDAGAVEALAPLVYDRLRGIAEAYLRNERLDHTLQPTAVVNEVFLELLRLRRLSLKDRAHFFTFAAQLTRRVLIDSARQAKSAKRGFGWQRAPLDAELAWLGGETAESLDLSRGRWNAACDSRWPGCAAVWPERHRPWIRLRKNRLAGGSKRLPHPLAPRHRGQNTIERHRPQVGREGVGGAGGIVDDFERRHHATAYAYRHDRHRNGARARARVHYGGRRSENDGADLRPRTDRCR
jgi:hypothetical protein